LGQSGHLDNTRWLSGLGPVVSAAESGEPAALLIHNLDFSLFVGVHLSGQPLDLNIPTLGNRYHRRLVNRLLRDSDGLEFENRAERSPTPTVFSSNSVHDCQRGIQLGVVIIPVGVNCVFVDQVLERRRRSSKIVIDLVL